MSFRAFADLFTRLDSTTKTNAKVAALKDYFGDAAPADAAWAVYFLSGRKLKRLINSRLMREWAAEEAEIPDWLFEESYSTVGDLAEAVALLLPPPVTSSEGMLADWVEQRLQPLAKMEEDEQRATLIEAWSQTDAAERFVWNKLITGSFRVGVSQTLVMRALAQQFDLEPATIAHRMMGTWEPTPEFFEGLVGEDMGEADLSRPYPFALAHPLEQEPTTLGDVSEWQKEWKWDGIRAQIIRREGEHFLWSRGEDMMLDRFPELAPLFEALPDGVALDGEILAWKDGRVLPFGELQKRIGRKTIGKKTLADVPCIFLAFDLLEENGDDLRELPFSERRSRLETLHAEIASASDRFRLSQTLTAATWEELGTIREASRENLVEGIMLKKLDAPYPVGRPRGPWWKWKIAPLTIDAVLIYAQKGHGRRASLFTDYTFAVWKDEELVPFAKAYSGLTDEEIRKVDNFVKRNTLERFGPVRSVTPKLVFELAFENIQRSSRHKSGIAVRFPRMLRWRHDKTPADADSLQTILDMIPD